MAGICEVCWGVWEVPLACFGVPGMYLKGSWGSTKVHVWFPGGPWGVLREVAGVPGCPCWVCGWIGGDPARRYAGAFAIAIYTSYFSKGMLLL